jgi:hypothetical protein
MTQAKDDEKIPSQCLNKKCGRILDKGTQTIKIII